MRRICAVIVLCAGVVSAAACDNSSTPTTPSTGGNTSFTQVFSAALNPGETPSFNFTLPGTAALHIMFGSLVNAAGLPQGSTVTMVYGIPTTDGLGCQALTQVSTAAALKAQINVVASSGQYCVALANTSGVAAGGTFAIRLIYGTATSLTGAETITYASSVLPTGATSRSFEASEAGTVTATLESFSPASVAALGLALGFQRNDGSGCEVSSAIIASRGTAFSLPVDAGRYCVKVFDPGTLTEVATFSVKIVHP